MKKASTTGFVIAMAAVGIFVLSASFFVGRLISLENTDESFSKTIDYLREQCISYDEIINADKVKSLIRLTEKATEIAFHFNKDAGSYPADWLNDFAVSQRISAIKIIDKDLKTEFSYTETPAIGGWDNLIAETVVSSVIANPKTIYSERAKKNGMIYDIAVVGRKDTNGAVLCCFQQNKSVLETKQATVENLLASYEPVLNGQLFITENNKIIGTNIDLINGDSAAAYPLIKELGKQPVSEKLIQLKEENGYLWYAGKAGYRDYEIYVFYPAKNVFSECAVIMGVAFAVYIIFVFTAVIFRTRVNHSHLLEIRDKYETINAISKIYVSCVLLDFKNNTYDFLQSKYGTGKRKGAETVTEFLSNIGPEHVGEKYRKEYAEFIDPETLGDRLIGNNYIFYIYQSPKGLWQQDLLVEKERDKDGRLCSALLIVRNINNFKQKEISYQKQLENAIEKEKLANNAKTDFLRRMSHDVRTPINVIIGMTKIAQKNRNDTENRDYCNAKTLEAAEFLIELVDDILTINKLDAGETEFKKSEFVLEKEVSEVSSIVSVQALAKNVTVEPPEIKTEHKAFIGADLYFRQIILNIMTNAVKYNKDGGKITTSFTEKETDGKTFIEFICEDTGIGMSPEYQKHMFEPFSQENAVTKNVFGGIGLGLSVVSRLTAVMGGTVAVESEQGVGTKFTITVPLEPTERVIEEQPKETQNLDGINILMAEDNELNAEIAEFILKEKKATVTCVTNGKDAVSAFTSSLPHEFDLILMDVMMPEMTGIEATKVIRKLDRPDAKTIPIFAMTAYLFDEDIAECKKAGMDEHIAKPINAEKLTEAILKYVRKERDIK